jgi:hypothetical protein
VRTYRNVVISKTGRRIKGGCWSEEAADDVAGGTYLSCLCVAAAAAGVVVVVDVVAVMFPTMRSFRDDAGGKVRNRVWRSHVI